MHIVLPNDRNATIPVGVWPDDLTLAESLTLSPTHAGLGLTDTLVVEGRLACPAVVAAFAGRANSAPVAVATAVTDTSRTNLRDSALIR